MCIMQWKIGYQIGRSKYVFKYLRVDMLVDGLLKDKVNHITDEGKKVGGVLRHLSRGRRVSMEAKKEECARV